MEFRTFVEAVDVNTVIQKTVGWLGQIEQMGFTLLTHQTHRDTAKMIVQSQDFGNNSGLHGTTLMTSANSFGELMERMYQAHHASTPDEYRQIAGGQIHRGSNAVVAMFIPKRFRHLTDLDDELADLMMNGELDDLKLPNSYIAGYFDAIDGTFNANGKFTMQGPLK